VSVNYGSLKATSRAVATRFRPSRFALYKALSAARSRLSGIRIVPPCRESAVATPTLTVPGDPFTKCAKAIVEPVFGQIKERRGFRRFSLRGLENVRHEWKMVCLASNLLKLFGSGWTPQTA